MRFLLALLLLASPLEAQTYIIVVPTDEVRRYIAGEWDSAVVERGFCGTFTLGIATDGEPLLFLNTAGRAANERNATATGVQFSCPIGEVPIHLHLNAVCGPSMKDLRHIRVTRALFGIVVCGPRHYAGFTSKLTWPKQW